MPIQLTCTNPRCRFHVQPHTVRDALAGKGIPCTGCGATLQVPAKSAANRTLLVVGAAAGAGLLLVGGAAALVVLLGAAWWMARPRADEPKLAQLTPPPARVDVEPKPITPGPPPVSPPVLKGPEKKDPVPVPPAVKEPDPAPAQADLRLFDE